MTLRISEMPCSFTGQALYSAATSKLMGVEQQSTPRAVLQNIAWIVYYVGVNALCAPLGLVYHSAAAIAHKVRSFATDVPEAKTKQAALAWEHFKSACTDLLGIGLFVCLYFRARVGRRDIPYDRFLWLWFSSTNVQTVNPPPQISLPYYEIERGVLSHWGKAHAPSFREVSYVELRLEAYRIRTQDLEDPSLIENALQENWKSLKEWSYITSIFWLKRPSFEGSQYVMPSTQEKPTYTISWKAVAWTVAGVASFALVCYLFFPLPPAIYFLNPQISLGITGWVGGSIGLILYGVKTHLLARGVAQKALADRLMTEIATDTSKTFNGEKANRALGWYYKAASNGCTTAQRFFGLGLLASLSLHKNATTMDDTELMLVKEAVQWLQSAAINGDAEALEDLRQILNISIAPTQRIYQGIQGNTENERVRNMFLPENDFMEAALGRYQELYAEETRKQEEKKSANERIAPELLAQIPEKVTAAIKASCRRPITTRVADITGIPPAVTDIVSRFVIGE